MEIIFQEENQWHIADRTGWQIQYKRLVFTF